MKNITDIIGDKCMSQLINTLESKSRNSYHSQISEDVDAVLIALSRTNDWEEGFETDRHDHCCYEAEISVVIAGIKWTGIGMYCSESLEAVEDIEFDSVVDIQKNVS